MAEIQFNGKEWEVSDALQAFYVPYASYVIQTRALPDARDGLKTGARFILYAQYKDKLTCKNKRRKAVATVNAAMRFSPHGDSSILGTTVRMSQDFSLRYPVIEIQGNNGSYLCGDDYSQSRYLECRGNEIAYEMTELLDKNTIEEWKLNYLEEEEYPTVLPSRFPYALVNGSFGIGVACASSIPPHNINDVCAAVKVFINNPNCTFEEIYCPIDFPTGGTIVNEQEVKESLKNGTGKAAIIRAKIEYDDKERELVVTEMPYMTFTNNAVRSINNALEQGLIPGVESVYDGTDYNGCQIFIKLTKTANPEKVTKMLYKHTILQNSYSINMNMLDNGKVPKLFTWKESVEAYVKHLRTVLIRALEFDLKKIKDRIHILEGLIKAYHNIEELVKDIRKSSSAAAAKELIMGNYSLSDIQADAILRMKLSSLTKLEIEKLEKEKSDKEAQAKEIEEILNSEDKIKAEMVKEIDRIQKKYGDARRTKNITLDYKKKDDDDIEVIEEKELLIHYTNLGNIYTQESTTLLTSRRGTKGTKVKMGKNEVIVKTINDNNLTSLLAFTNKGKMYSIYTSDLPIGSRINVEQLYEFEDGEYITSLTTLARKNEIPYFIFITKDGMIKKTKATEYENKRGKSIKAINLKDGDEVINVLFVKDEKIGLLASNGNFIIIETDNISAVGRAAMGVKGIKLDDGCSVVDSRIVDKKYIVAAASSGLIKRTAVDEFGIATRGTKGKRIQKLEENDKTVKFSCVNEEDEIVIVSPGNVNKIKVNEIRAVGRDCAGVTGSKNGIVDLI